MPWGLVGMEQKERPERGMEGIMEKTRAVRRIWWLGRKDILAMCLLG